MEPSVIAAIITVTGGTLLSAIGFFLQRLYVRFDAYDKKFDAFDKKFDAFDERITLRVDRLEARIGKLEEKVETLGVELRTELNSLKLAVGKLEFAQEHQSEQLAQIASYSDRISRLERAVFNSED